MPWGTRWGAKHLHRLPPLACLRYPIRPILKGNADLLNAMGHIVSQRRIDESSHRLTILLHGWIACVCAFPCM